MELAPGTIKHLQEYVTQKIKARGFEDESLHERLLLLTEELGELVKACRKVSGMNVNQQDKAGHDPGEEIADVINLLFAVGIKLGMDIEKEFIAKNKKVDERIYKRQKKLEP